MYTFLNLYRCLAVLVLCFTSSISADNDGKGCNRTIVKPAGTINSPGNYSANQTCVYTFTNEDSKPIFITINKLHMADGAVLQVYFNDSHGLFEPIATFIQSTTTDAASPIVLYSNAPNTTVIYTSGSALSTYEFGYSRECMVTTNAMSGYLQTPLYLQSSHGSPIACDYVIATNDTLHWVATSFEHENLVKGSLLIYDGDVDSGPLLRNVTFDGSNAPMDDVIGSTTTMTLRFLLSTVVKQDRFAIAYAIVSSNCSGYIDLDDPNAEVTIQSPDYPNDYTNGLRCRAIVTYPKNTILFHFEDLSLADQFDSVTLIDGASKSSPFIERLSQNKPEVFMTSGGALWVEFISDESGVGKGFNLSLKSVEYGGRMYSEGTFGLSSANTSELEQLTAGNTDNVLYYQLTAKAGTRVGVSMNTSALLYPTTTLEFYEGTRTTDPLITSFASDKTFYNVYANGGEMLVVARGFLTDNGTVGQQHFSANFWSEASDKAHQYSSGETETFVLSGDDVTTDSVTWDIYKPRHAVVNNAVQLSISELRVPTGYDVTVYGGLPSLPSVIAHYNTTPDHVPSMYFRSDARIVFTKMNPNASLDTQSESGSDVVLQANYHTVPACGHELSGDSGSFSSPNFPDRYPYYTRCEWTKTTSNSTLLHITFPQFNLASKHFVNVDEEVNNTWQTMNIYTGSKQPNDVISSMNTSASRVQFSSELSARMSQGFTADYQVLECGGSLTVNAGYVSTPDYPAHVTNTTLCVWLIAVPPAEKEGTTNIIEFDYEVSSKDKHFNGSLEIKDGGSSMADLLEVKQKKGKAKGVFSRYDVIMVTYSYNWTKGEDSGFAFKLNFKASKCSKLCDNGVCLRSAWRCDFVDQCGDGTDERDCTMSNAHTKYRVPAWAIFLTIFVTFLVAVGVTIAAPRVYRRCRGRGYSELRDLMAPVPT